MKQKTIETIIDYLDELDEIEAVLNEEINNLQTKSEREQKLEQTQQQMQTIRNNFLKILPSRIKKIRERGQKMNAQQKLRELGCKLDKVQNVWEKQEDVTKKFKDPSDSDDQNIRETRVRNTYFNPNAQISAQARNEYEETTELAKKGARDAQNTLKELKAANEELNNIGVMVKIQRIKLEQIKDKMQKSQSLVNQSSRIMTSFSKELYSDKIIFGLLSLIALILILIMISAIKYKLKSKELIGNEIDLDQNNQDIAQIDENLFYRTEIIEVSLQDLNKQEESVENMNEDSDQPNMLQEKIKTKIFKKKVQNALRNYLTKFLTKKETEEADLDMQSKIAIQNFSENSSEIQNSQSIQLE